MGEGLGSMTEHLPAKLATSDGNNIAPVDPSALLIL